MLLKRETHSKLMIIILTDRIPDNGSSLLVYYHEDVLERKVREKWNKLDED